MNTAEPADLPTAELLALLSAALLYLLLQLAIGWLDPTLTGDAAEQGGVTGLLSAVAGLFGLVAPGILLGYRIQRWPIVLALLLALICAGIDLGFAAWMFGGLSLSLTSFLLGGTAAAYALIVIAATATYFLRRARF